MTGTSHLTAEQAAEILMVKPKTIMEWARVGRLSAAKVGRRWFFSQAEIAAQLTPVNQLSFGKPRRR